jgi:hypothetical protein
MAAMGIAISKRMNLTTVFIRAIKALKSQGIAGVTVPLLALLLLQGTKPAAEDTIGIISNVNIIMNAELRIKNFFILLIKLFE